jgi:hypothetical protein
MTPPPVYHHVTILKFHLKGIFCRPTLETSLQAMPFFGSPPGESAYAVPPFDPPAVDQLENSGIATFYLL